MSAISSSTSGLVQQLAKKKSLQKVVIGKLSESQLNKLLGNDEQHMAMLITKKRSLVWKIIEGLDVSVQELIQAISVGDADADTIRKAVGTLVNALQLLTENPTSISGKTSSEDPQKKRGDSLDDMNDEELEAELKKTLAENDLFAEPMVGPKKLKKKTKKKS